MPSYNHLHHSRKYFISTYESIYFDKQNKRIRLEYKRSEFIQFMMLIKIRKNKILYLASVSCVCCVCVVSWKCRTEYLFVGKRSRETFHAFNFLLLLFFGRVAWPFFFFVAVDMNMFPCALISLLSAFAHQINNIIHCLFAFVQKKWVWSTRSEIGTMSA